MDELLNIVSELVLGRNQLAQVNSEASLEYEGSKLAHDLAVATKQIDLMTNELQLVVMKTRMVKIGKVFNRFPRLVRDLSKEIEKGVNLVIKGEETELDKTLIEEINDPLVHLVRNSVDHGIDLHIESGTVYNNHSDRIVFNLYRQHSSGNILPNIHEIYTKQLPRGFGRQVMGCLLQTMQTHFASTHVLITAISEQGQYLWPRMGMMPITPAQQQEFDLDCIIPVSGEWPLVDHAQLINIYRQGLCAEIQKYKGTYGLNNDTDITQWQTRIKQMSMYALTHLMINGRSPLLEASTPIDARHPSLLGQLLDDGLGRLTGTYDGIMPISDFLEQVPK